MNENRKKGYMKKIIVVGIMFLVSLTMVGQVSLYSLKKVSNGADMVTYALRDSFPSDNLQSDTLAEDSVLIDSLLIDTVRYDSTELDYADVEMEDTIFRDGYVRVLTEYHVTQPELLHQISFRLFGGYSAMLYNPDHGSSEMSLGWSERLEYKYWYYDNFGIGTGLYVGVYRSSCRMSGYTLSTEMYDSENNLPYTYNAAYDGVRERQRMYEVEIPVGGYFRTLIVEDFSFVGGAGFKFGVPLNTTYRYKGGTYTTTAYYPSTGVTYHDLPQHGLTTFMAKDYEGDIEFGSINIAFYLDLGVAYRLNRLVNLYAGLYTAIGLVDLKPKDAFGTGVVSVLNSGACGKVRTFELGLTVGADLNLGKGMKKSDLYN